MGTAFGTAFGNPPNPLTAAFRDWCDAAVAYRLAECRDAARPNGTFYYAQDGDDTTGDGTIGNPWQTLAKANTQIAAGSGGEQHLFRRGDQWRESTQLTVTAKTAIRLGDYGSPSAAKPRIVKFSAAYPDTGWTLDSGAYYRVDADGVAWVRNAANPFGGTPTLTGEPAAFMECATIAECQANDWSFFFDTGTQRIWIRTDGGTQIPDGGIEIEPVVSNTGATAANGVFISSLCDLTHVRNIICEGHGIHRTTLITQTQGHTTEATGTNACLFDGCESYYNGSHNLQHNRGTGTGGIVTFYRCAAGFPRPNTTNETQINGFASGGGNETYHIECVAARGTLPGTGWFGVGGRQRRGNPFFGHTTSGTINLGLAYKCVVPDVEFGAAQGAMYNNLPSVSGDITLVRGFSVDEIVEGGPSVGNGHQPARFNHVYLNPRWTFQPIDDIPSALTPTAQGGWVINGLLVLDNSLCTGNMSAWNASTASVNEARFIHCHIYVIDTGIRWRYCHDNGSLNCRIFNTIHQKVAGTGPAHLGGMNNTTSVQNCAFYDFTASTTVGYDSTLNPVVLGSLIATDARQMNADADPLVEYDIDWTPRSLSGPQSLGVMSDLDPPVPDEGAAASYYDVGYYS